MTVAHDLILMLRRKFKEIGSSSYRCALNAGSKQLYKRPCKRRNICRKSSDNQSPDHAKTTTHSELKFHLSSIECLQKHLDKACLSQKWDVE